MFLHQGAATSHINQPWPSTRTGSAFHFSVDTLTSFGLDRFRPWLRSHSSGKSLAERERKKTANEGSARSAAPPPWMASFMAGGRAQKVTRDRKRCTGRQLIVHKPTFPSTFQREAGQQICACARVCTYTAAGKHSDMKSTQSWIDWFSSCLCINNVVVVVLSSHLAKTLFIF